MATPEEIKAEYTSSLADLTFNSKPLINVLTMLAEENLPNAKVIVEAIEMHLSKVATEVKLPVLYLIDCIVKNVGRTYTTLFSHNIVSTFCSVFKVVDEKTRAEMFKLRQTWNEVFPQMKLFAIDVQISMIDPAWPVTAQPSNSIHLNPKFLKNTNNPPAPKVPTETPVIIPQGASGDIDKETLLMQEQLIQKQKELLELQRKTLELEVLQTQVKLQEQIKSGGPPISTNILLKPEVAKQLIPEAIVKAKTKNKGMGSSVMQQRLQGSMGNQNRIHPVSNALASAKPIRDPRLHRQQQSSAQVPVESVSQPVTATAPIRQKPAANENSKSVNKFGVRDIRKDPRLLNKGDKTKPKTFPKSQQQQPDAQKETREAKVDAGKDGSPKSSISSSGSSVNSVSSATDSNKNEMIKSPTKSKKREKLDSLNVKDVIKTDKPKKEEALAFKSVKSSKKSRNYIRHNLSESPEPPRDEDLRSLPPPDKQPRLEHDLPDKVLASESTIKPVNKNMDVDLRQLTTVIGKKRPSTESSDQASKKSKSFDVLFGNEDTDLRQLPVDIVSPALSSSPRAVQLKSSDDRPPTPPPPIISSEEPVKQKTVSPKKNDLDIVRAKLANATNRDKVMSKSFHKRKLASANTKDQDLRLLTGQQDDSSARKAILISPEDEQCIQSGAMTKEQEKSILSKIFMQIEKEKLNEAKKKDHEQSSLNTSLQPISDDELEYDPEDDITIDVNKSSPSDNEDSYIEQTSEDTNDQPKQFDFRGADRREYEDSSASSRVPAFNDKDERLTLSSHIPYQNTDVFYPRDMRRPPFRPTIGWRVRGRGNHPIRQPMRPWIPQQQYSKWRHFGTQEFSHALDEDSANSDVSSEFTVLKEDLKTINIDGIPREIRCYNETAIIFLNWDDPREISFQAGSRGVTFNGTDIYVLSFGDSNKECLISNFMHLVKLGVPTREIFIDNVGYECYFGGSPVTVRLNGANVTVQLDGPLPQVKISDNKRTDLVVGKINLIIDAKVIVPVFLDAKEQKFVIDGETSTLKFVDALKTVLINDIPFNVEFGGLPKPFTVHGKKHFIRFSVLPKGIRPGYVHIKEMEGESSLSPSHDDSNQDVPIITSIDDNELVNSDLTKAKHLTGQESPDNRSKSPSFFQNLLQPALNNFDVISNVLSTSVTPAPTAGSYRVENNPVVDSAEAKETLPATTSLTNMQVNINDLFQKLVASGFVKTTPNKTPQQHTNLNDQLKSKVQPTKPIEKKKLENGDQAPKPVKKNLIQNLRPIDFKRPETLKVRQGALYDALYSGMPCSSCGMRFPPEASILYSQHLDWHFRQNRKGKRNIRVAASRKWYYSLSDWKNYEEIEDLEEREKNYFDQQQQAEVAAEDADEEMEIPSVPADPNSTNEFCEVCRDTFEQFFNEEKEEWHLKNAIKVDEKTYHPICYEDYQKSLAEQSLDESKSESTNIEAPKLIPGLEIILDDDDDDEYQPGSPNDVVSLPDDDEDSKFVDIEKQPEEKEEEKPAEEEADEEDDDDVILNEVAPIKIVVDDDDDELETEVNHKTDSMPAVKKEKNVDDDGFVDVGEGLVSLTKVGQIKIKSEPVDPDDILSTSVLDQSQEVADTSITIDKVPDVPVSHPELITSIDGNIELVSSAPVSVATSGISGNKIKINISKPLPVISQKEKEIETSVENTIIDPNEPYPPGEEPHTVSLKPALQDVKLKKLPPIKKGTELTGLCSIM